MKAHVPAQAEGTQQKRNGTGASLAPPAYGLSVIDNATVQRKENKTGLPDQLKSGVESLSGMDMSDVKVHYNSSQPAQLNAHAYAQGNQIHVAPGQEKHLPHEAWHVVQQKQGRVKATLQMKGKVNVNDDHRLEREADMMGAKALTTSIAITQRRSVSTSSGASQPLQLKAGVEYETNWDIIGASEGDHRAKIYNGDGWHIECDDGHLEFVVDPPQGSAEGLKNKVGLMSQKGQEIIAKTNDDNTLASAAMGAVTAAFTGKKIHRGTAGMPARPQFTFGVQMDKIAHLFKALRTAKFHAMSYEESRKNFNFFGINDDQAMTTIDFLKVFGPGHFNSIQDKMTTMESYSGEVSAKMNGFLSYVGYYIGRMSLENLGSTTELKAAYLAQEIAAVNGLTNANFETNLDLKLAQLGYGNAIKIHLLTNAELWGADGFEEAGEAKAKLKRFVSGTFHSPKYWFTFMNRSGFDKMYQSLGQADQLWFAANQNRIIADLGKQINSPLFGTPYTYERKDAAGQPLVDGRGLSLGPTIAEWFQSIIASRPAVVEPVAQAERRDALSPPAEFIKQGGEPDREQAMGRLNKLDATTIPDYTGSIDNTKDVELVVIELRQWGDNVKVAHWKDHAYDMAVLYSLISGGDLDSKYIRKYYGELKKLEAWKQTLEADDYISKSQATIDARIKELDKQRSINQGKAERATKNTQRQHFQNANSGIKRQIAALQHDKAQLTPKIVVAEIARIQQSIVDLKKLYGQ